MAIHNDQFFRRWSRLKQASEAEKSAQPEQPQSDDVVSESEQSVDNTTFDEADLPVWQRADADPQEKREALRALFRKPQFNRTDGLDEYDNDYNYHQFAGLGSVVTHEMKRMLKLAEDAAKDDTKASDVSSADAPAEPDSDQQEDPPVA